MASYLKINNYSNEGSLSLSKRVFEDIVAYTIKQFDNVTKSNNALKSLLNFNESTSVYIRDGKAQITLSVDIKKGHNVKEICNKMIAALQNNIEMFVEQAPVKIKVKVEHII